MFLKEYPFFFTLKSKKTIKDFRNGVHIIPQNLIQGIGANFFFENLYMETENKKLLENLFFPEWNCKC